MRLVENSRGDWQVTFDIDRCAACGASFRRLGTYRPDITTCEAHDDHYLLTCRACGHVTWDTVCDLDVPPHHPLEGHRDAALWDDVQHGPTVDYGDG